MISASITNLVLGFMLLLCSISISIFLILLIWEAVSPLGSHTLLSLRLNYIVAHGTFIGNIRLESHKPTQLHMNSQFHFGASTRSYILRERPTTGVRPNIMEDIPLSDAPEGALLGLPESQSELDVSNMNEDFIIHHNILKNEIFFLDRI